MSTFPDMLRASILAMLPIRTNITWFAMHATSFRLSKRTSLKYDQHTVIAEIFARDLFSQFSQMGPICEN